MRKGSITEVFGLVVSVKTVKCDICGINAALVFQVCVRVMERPVHIENVTDFFASRRAQFLRKTVRQQRVFTCEAAFQYLGHPVVVVGFRGIEFFKNAELIDEYEPFCFCKGHQVCRLSQRARESAWGVDSRNHLSSSESK